MKLDDVIEMLEFLNQDMDSSAYYNEKTNEFIYLNQFSDMSEDELEEIYDNCIELPSKYYIDEYGMMEEFIETIEDVKLYNQLKIVINGRGAFRRFKDTCINFDIIDNWYKFRDEKYKEIATEWCNKNKIKYE